MWFDSIYPFRVYEIKFNQPRKKKTCGSTPIYPHAINSTSSPILIGPPQINVRLVPSRLVWFIRPDNKLVILKKTVLGRLWIHHYIVEVLTLEFELSGNPIVRSSCSLVHKTPDFI